VDILSPAFWRGFLLPYPTYLNQTSQKLPPRKNISPISNNHFKQHSTKPLAAIPISENKRITIFFLMSSLWGIEWGTAFFDKEKGTQEKP
jgi:hypothetical protein